MSNEPHYAVEENDGPDDGMALVAVAMFSVVTMILACLATLAWMVLR